MFLRLWPCYYPVWTLAKVLFNWARVLRVWNQIFNRTFFFATRRAGIAFLFIAISFGATSCKQEAGTSLLSGEVEGQAQRIALIEEQLEKLSTKHKNKLAKLQAEVEAKNQLLQEAKEIEEALATERNSVHAELKLLKEHPPAPRDTIILANGQAIEGYISGYANGVFTVAMPNGETKKGRSTAFQKIAFNISRPAEAPQEEML